jgi:hypothetical protein
VLPNTFPFVLMRFLQLTTLIRSRSMHMWLKVEANAHYVHPLKGANKYNYNKFHPSVVMCYVELQGYE